MSSSSTPLDVLRHHRTTYFRALALGMALLACFSAAVHAQRAMTVSGYVSAGGAPVRGASVTIPALGMSVSSDREGRYSFILAASQVYGQTVTMSARYRGYAIETLALTLTGAPLVKDFELRAPKPNVDVADRVFPAIVEGSVARVAEAREAPRGASLVDSRILLESVGQSSLARELRGREAGVDVVASTTQGGSARVIVRGPQSVSGNDQPLYILDGLPIDNSSSSSEAQRLGRGGFDYGGTEQDLNLADVASVELIKGPLSVALYGSRAASGALLITTRRGQDLNDLVISASQQLTFDSPQRLPAFQNQYGQGLGGKFEFVNGAGAGVNDSVAQSWGPALDGRPLAQFSYSQAGRPEVRLWVSKPDNVKNFFTTGRTLTTNVGVQGSTDRTSGRFSFGNQDVGGIVPNSYFARKTATLGIERTFTNRLHGSLNVDGSSSAGRNRPGTGIDGANPMFGFVQMGRQVDLSALDTHRRDTAGDQISWNYAGQNNPYFGAFENGNSDTRQRLIGQGSATFDLTSWLVASGRLGTDLFHDRRDFHVATGWMSGFEDYVGRGDFSKGGFQSRDIHAQQTNADLALRARARPDSNFRIGTTVGMNRRNDALRVDALAVDELLVPGVYEIGNAAKPTLSSRSDATFATTAVFGSSEIAFRDVASLEMGLRGEQTNALAKAHDHYLDASVGARLALTRIWPAARLGGLFSEGTVHGGWGHASNPLYPLDLQTQPTTPFGTLSRSGVPDVLANPDLRPETTTGWEWGTTFRTLSGRADIDVTFYSNRRAHQVLVVPLPTSSGFTATTANAGTLTNTGLEAQVSANLLRHSSLSWDITGTYATNTNRVRSLGEGLSPVALGPSLWGLSIQARDGYPLGVLVGNRFLRDASGELLLRDGHPLPDTAIGPQVLGNSLPKWTAGFSNRLRYRALELTALVDVRWGAKIFSATNLLGAYSGVLAETAFRPDSGLLINGIDATTGKQNTTHVTSENYYHSLLPIQERWIYDASFVRLSDVRLTFALAPNFAFFARGGTARVSIVGRNLYLWTRAPNIDPETALSTAAFQGAELGQLPSVRSLGLQLSVTP